VTGLLAAIEPVTRAAAEGGGGLQFPPIENLVLWPAWFAEGTIFEFNKITFISVFATVLTLVLFFIVGRNAKLVPTGLQNLMETSVDFVEKQVITAAIGPDGMRYLPMLLSMFFFIFITNLFEVIPTSHMPGNARMANPLVLALLALVMYVGVGVKHNGLGYFKAALFPPGVPKALYILVTPIELLSTFIIRPFSLAVRLFANMFAGHLLIATFSIAAYYLLSFTVIGLLGSVASFTMAVALTGFELLIQALQAYIFTLLTAVYISGALHAEH
jgi:F-type H+-transporting ATPase subunit a